MASAAVVGPLSCRAGGARAAPFLAGARPAGTANFGRVASEPVNACGAEAAFSLTPSLSHAGIVYPGNHIGDNVTSAASLLRQFFNIPISLYAVRLTVKKPLAAGF